MSTTTTTRTSEGYRSVDGQVYDVDQRRHDGNTAPHDVGKGPLIKTGSMFDRVNAGRDQVGQRFLAEHVNCYPRACLVRASHGFGQNLHHRSVIRLPQTCDSIPAPSLVHAV